MSKLFWNIFKFIRDIHRPSGLWFIWTLKYLLSDAQKWLLTQQGILKLVRKASLVLTTKPWPIAKLQIFLFFCIFNIFCRFSPTAAHPPWSGILQAISYGPACPQQFPTNLSNQTESLNKMTKEYWQYLNRVKDSITHQAEDCLYLNIFRPHNASGSLPSVLFLLINLCFSRSF